MAHQSNPNPLDAGIFLPVRNVRAEIPKYSGLTKTSTALPRLSSKRTIL
ncbi:hypothetical protein NEIPOLOT_00352 [Neisseria polysaccharea ATCC 43768]|nr:hypothetical protein NEIPOLOT_00352 [Neisseria polysaccharea ATCC 43768]